MTPIRRILVPCDFSLHSKRALDKAISLAARYKGEITAMCVLPQPMWLGASPQAGPIGVDAATRERVRSELDVFVKPARAAGLGVHVELFEGPIAAEIVKRAESLEADIVVMGTHGATGFGGLGFGSVTERVLRSCTRPVLTIPHSAGTPIPGSEMKQIVCPIDFMPPSTKAAGLAQALAEDAGARLTLLHVIAGYPEPIDLVHLDVAAYMRGAEADAHRRLQAVVPGGPTTTSTREALVSSGRAWREILRVAAERRADLIVMGVAGHGPIEHLFFGSTTRHVVERATCPVLTVRA